MTFQKGKSGNPAGRPVGSKNRFTKIKELLCDAFEKRAGELSDMDLKALTNAVVALSPKEKSVDVSFNEPLQVCWLGEEDDAESSDSVQTEIPTEEDPSSTGEGSV